MDNATRPSRAFGFRNGPGLCSGGDKHLAARSAHPAQRIPVNRRGRAATGTLRAVLRFIKVGLLNADVLPVDVKFFRDEHGHARFDALTDLGILAHDGYGPVSGNAHEGKWLKRRCGRLRRSTLSSRGKCLGDRFKMVGEEKSTASDGRNIEKRATIKECGVHGASFGDRRDTRSQGYTCAKGIVNQLTGIP